MHFCRFYKYGLYLFVLILFLSCCPSSITCCTKVTFVDSVVEITTVNGITAKATITGCIVPEIIAQHLGAVTVTKIESQNQTIPVFNGEAIANFPKLWSIQFQLCKIKHIKENAFFNLPELTNLDLSKNDIVTVDLNAFVNPNLNTIDLSRNKLVFLENNIFARLPNLLSLYLGHNQLDGFKPEWCSESLKLNTIAMQKNSIQTVHQNIYTSFKLLQNIHLANNHIKYIHRDAFYGLEQLEFLYLHNNRISKLQPGVFRSLSKISAAWIYGNNLTYISQETLHELSRTKTLWQVTIHTNPWQCACYENILKWAREYDIYLVEGTPCTDENNPACVVPKENAELCLEVHDEDLDAIYYQNYKEPDDCSYEEE